jgi:CubicO group peptidase (beta-lactamase class C family)
VVEKWAKLESFIFEKMAETKLPGLSAAAISGDKIVWERGLGFRDLASGLPATPHTLYGIGSITKSFTAIAILQLAEGGKLSLDDPVEKFLPISLRPSEEPILIRHLLSHSSGIPALGYAEAVIRAVTGAGGKSLPIATASDILTFMADAGEWTVARPGERWFYLNEGYVLLGAMVERCCGVPYEDYVREHILRPLGMERSFFRKEEVEGDPDAATPYVITREGERRPSTYPYGGIFADGGLISNAWDLSRYVAMYLNLGELQGTRVLSEESIKAMGTPCVQEPFQGPFGEEGYGLGLMIFPNFLGRKLLCHGGSVEVSTAWMGFVPEERVGIVLLANGSGYPMSQLGMYGLAILVGEAPDELPFARWERTLSELTGTYETYKGTMQAQVRRAGDFLMLELGDRYTELVVPLVPEGNEGNTVTFYTWQGRRKLPVEFLVREGRVELIYERYLLRRVGPVSR